MNSYNWDIFTNTGKIQDYLKYKDTEVKSLSECNQFACVKGEQVNVNNNRGSSNT